MNITTEKKNSVNIVINATIADKDIEKKLDRLASEAGKQIKVDGFRKGKVPAHIVKKLHGEKLRQDAEGEALRELLNHSYKENDIDPKNIIGDPMIKKYEKIEEGIEVSVQLCLRPSFDTTGYESVLPKYEAPSVEEKEVDERISKLAEQVAEAVSITQDRPLKEGDIAVFDFTGYIDGEKFDGGSAEGYELEIGSGRFIPGFEDQMVGMKRGEERKIDIKFPEEYQSEKLKGKEAQFEIKLNDIKEKVTPAIDDELAKKIMKKEDATLEQMKQDIRAQIKSEKLNKLYNEELKPKLLEALVEYYEFDLPENIVEQEIDNLANQKAGTMKAEEIESLRKDPEKITELRESVRQEAVKSVKATFIVDMLAKSKNISVDDQEVTQALYYEAVISGQDPKNIIDYYQKNNLIPALKMGMLEDRLFSRLLELDKAGN